MHEGGRARTTSRAASGASRRCALALSALALVAALPATASAQRTSRKPLPWIVSVVHRFEVSKLAEQMSTRDTRIEHTGRRYSFNLTTGVVIDADGHVVTRLVNLDPTAPSHDVKVTTTTGRVLDAAFVGLDQPTGLVVLQVAGLRGTKPGPGVDRALAGATPVRVVSAEFSIKNVNIPPQVERIAIYPSLFVNPGRVADSAVSPAYARGGVSARVECGILTKSTDLSVVETADGAVVGLVKYASPGRGDLISIGYARDIVARRVVAARGSVASGWLGAIGMSLSAVPAPRRPAWATDGGVVIQTISADGPAATAGLQLNDVVVGIDGVPVRNVEDLTVALGATPAGTKVELSVVREAGAVRLETTLGARPLVGKSASLFLPSEEQTLKVQISQLYAERRRAKDGEALKAIQSQIDEAERRLAEIQLEKAAIPRP